jgi:gas vesicle protein
MDHRPEELNRDPAELQRDIDATRQRLRDDTDALSEKVHPGRVVGRRVERTRRTATRLRDKVMGTTDAGASSAGDLAGRATAQVESAASTVGGAVSDTVSAAPRMMRERTQGSPLAAGVIAFAAGWLVAGMLPATQPEKQLARAAEEQGSDAAGAVKDEARQMAQELKDDLREPARDATDGVRDSVMGAASNVRDQATSSAQDVADEAKQSAQNVRRGPDSQ